MPASPLLLFSEQLGSRKEIPAESVFAAQVAPAESVGREQGKTRHMLVLVAILFLFQGFLKGSCPGSCLL